MRSLALSRVPLERLRSQRLTGPPLPGPVEAVRWLVASQAQDFAGAKWALALRTRAATDADVEAAYDQGAILRTHVMRPTWHFVAAEDLRWLLALTSPRVHAANAPYCRAYGLDAAPLRKATRVLARALEGGRHLTRDELRAALARHGIDADGTRLAYAIMHAELEAVVCSGPRRGRQFTYALVDERVQSSRRLSSADALVELAARYLRSRGPATAQDFAKWSGLRVADARRGFEAVAPERQRALAQSKKPQAHLLSCFDEYFSSYRDRSAICDAAYVPRLQALGNALVNVLLLDGWVAGTWRRKLAKQTVTVEIKPYRRLSKEERRAVVKAGERLASFLGADVVPRIQWL